MTRPLARLLLTLAGVGAALSLLHRWDGAAAGPLSPAEPALLVVTLLRHAAVVAGWYLVAVTLAGGLARLVRLRSAVRVADRCTLPSLRRLLDASLGVSVLAASVASPAAWAGPPPTDEPPPATMLRLPDEAPDPPPPEPTTTTVAPTTTSTGSTVPATASTTTTTTTTTTSAGPPTTTGPPSTTSATASTAPVPTPRPPPPPVPSPEQPSPPTPAPAGDVWDEWTVQRGDHFWSIAERVLERAWQRPPGDAETDPYWRALVEANRARLADPANADLLFVGQVLAIPSPPAAPP